MNFMWAGGLCLFFFFISGVIFAETPRVEISLNGEWYVQKTADLSVPPTGEWKPFMVPGYLSGTNYERAWFKRSFDADPAWAGKRIKLHFGGVKFNSVVFLNGQKVGGNLGGYEPFELDITQAVKLGASNELLVGVHDWTGVFSEKVDLSNVKNWNELRGRPKNALLSPIGGLFGLYGIWEDVTLRILPQVYVADVFVKTSVRQKRLDADVTVTNEGATPSEILVKGQVVDLVSHSPALELPESKIAIKPGETKTFPVSQDWHNPKLWSHLQPNLYILKIVLYPVGHTASTTPLDAYDTRFGFREFWCEKDAFYLNGTKINMLATSTWPPHKIVDRAYIEETYRAVKEANCVAFRLHTQPWQKLYYEIADEMGLLIVVEGAVWCDQAYRFTDPRWWENYATHLRRTVDALKNHPSIIMWSLENEILACATHSKGPCPAKDGLAEMGRMMKKLDPTRPIFYESDLDPHGVADVIGLHYPHPEYPRVNQYPNVCYWVDGEIPMKPPLVDEGQTTWKWNRQKPLYIGEFLWVPARDPSVDTIFYGDDTYANFGKYHALAKATAWKMQIEAYRWHGVSGICPWTMFEGPGGVLARENNPLWVAVRDGFHPNAVFVKEYDSRFYAGDMITRTLTVYNDTFHDGEFTLTWSLTCGGQTVAEGKEQVNLPSATHRTIPVTFRAPAVSMPTEAHFKLALWRDKVCFEDTKLYRIYPQHKLTVPRSCHIGIYDPNGNTEKIFSNEGFAYIKVTSLAEIPKDVHILLIGERALPTDESISQADLVVGRPNPMRERLAAFVREGGRVLVLAQNKDAKNLIPVQRSDYASTIIFALVPTHPVLEGIAADDLKFWRGDHLVSENELVRPTAGGGCAILVSGSADGLLHTPLLEISRGKGVYLLCQLRIVEKMRSEPVAKRLLQNMLNYLDAFSPDTRATAVLSDSTDFKRLLSSLRVRAHDLTEKLAQSDLTRYGLLLVCGDVEELAAQQQKVRAYLDGGGRVLFHRLMPEDMSRLSAMFTKDVMLQAHRGRVSSINFADPLTRGWTRESLYWLGKHEGPGHARTPLADGVADFALVSRKTGQPILQFRAQEMTLEGGIVRPVAEGVVMATVGSASKKVEIPEDGRYGIVITAKGTPAAGVWPLVEVAVDDEPVNVVSVPSREWITVNGACELKKGAHTIKVSFINDYNRNGEDRNLIVKEVCIAKMPLGEEGFIPLTRPAFVARLDYGKGYAVIDEVTWDTESRNAHKALQYAQALLTNMGADFEDVWADVIGPDQMHEKKEMPHFTRTPTQVTLAASGYVSMKTNFATGGHYVFELVARGTPLDDIFPIVDVLLDEVKVGQIELKTEDWRSYPLEVQVTQGTHEIKLVYTNDAYRPPEDRNLYIQKLIISKR